MTAGRPGRDLGRITHHREYVTVACLEWCLGSRNLAGPLTKPAATRAARAHAQSTGHPVRLTLTHHQDVMP